MSPVSASTRRSFEFLGFCLAGGLLAVSIAGAAGCARDSVAAKAAPPSAPKKADDAVVTVVQRDATFSRVLPGELRAFEETAVEAKVSAFVRRVLVDRGDRVRAGQVLLRLQAPEVGLRRGAASARVSARRAEIDDERASLPVLRARVDAVAATFDEAKLSLGRLREAAKTEGAVPAHDLEVAERRVATAKAALAEGRAALAHREKRVASKVLVAEAEGQAVRPLGALERYLVVRAPFDGVITERNVHPGAFVSPSLAGRGAPLLRLRAIARLRLQVAVPEAEVPAIERGARLGFRVAAYPVERFEGVVARWAHALSRRTRTMAVELDVDNEAARLSPGMYAEVEWKGRLRRSALFVPSSAVAETAERVFVLRVGDGGTQIVDVRRGLRDGAQVEIVGAVSAGDRLVARATDEGFGASAARPR